MQEGRDRKRIFNLCNVFVCWGEFEQAGELWDAHGGGVGGGGGGGLQGVGLCSPVLLDVSGPEPECHIPFSGQTSSLVVNLTPFPPNTGPQTGPKDGVDRERRNT